MCDMICTNAVEFLEIIIKHIAWEYTNQPIFFDHIMEFKITLNCII